MLDQLYSLRKNFTVIGLTGRVGSGCSEIAQRLSEPDFNQKLDYLVKKESNLADELKVNICVRYLQKNCNWTNFKIINYKDVLLFHLLFSSFKSGKNIDERVDSLINILSQNGHSLRSKFSNRFDVVDNVCFKEIRKFLLGSQDWHSFFSISSIGPDTNSFLKGIRESNSIELFKFYFDYFEIFSKEFYNILNSYDLTKRSRLVHDLANNLRKHGKVLSEENNGDIANIYTVAETINILIKVWRTENDNTKIVIDSLKNSLELMYFKEKYSAFYMIATNKEESERVDYVKEQIERHFSSSYNDPQMEKHISEIIHLDNSEYKGDDVNKGVLNSPDIENCIQKCDYHLFFSKKFKGNKEGDLKQKYQYLNLDRQLVKLIALIHQPGIVTPTGLERTMQIAYNAKVNSGCISRQVGAIITDSNFSVKAVGWNDVPQNQIPCNLRNAHDLVSGNNNSHFSDFEKGSDNYKDGNDFKTKFIGVMTNSQSKIDANLNGRNCSYCFKTFHNSFEGKGNQVHTRSLHAEENAMMQITKYGGIGIKGGNLFTTASPCELCSKKAFQLGIDKIYYIDPYPGISASHILKNGTDENTFPKLLMFQGAVGRAFHKLYEPFMSYKDELNILTNMNSSLNMSSKKLNVDEKINSLTTDTNIQIQIKALLEGAKNSENV